MSIFSWLRRQVKEAFILGAGDAVEELFGSGDESTAGQLQQVRLRLTMEPAAEEETVKKGRSKAS